MPNNKLIFELVANIDKETETAKQIMEIFVTAFLALPIYKKDGEILKKAIVERIDLLNKSASSQQAVIAKENSVVIGIIFVERKVNSLYLVSGAVSPSYQKKGLAKKMLEAVLAHHKDITEVFLLTREDNINAITLYEHAGFTKNFTIYQDYPFLSERGYKYPPYLPFKIGIKEIQDRYPGLLLFNNKLEPKEFSQEEKGSMNKTIKEDSPLRAKL